MPEASVPASVSGNDPYDRAQFVIADALTDLHGAVDKVCSGEEYGSRTLDELETNALAIIHATAKLREIRAEEAEEQFAAETEEECDR